MSDKPLPFDKVPNFLVSIDEEYTALLNSRVRERFGSTAPRTATHLSGLLFCLLKEWANLHLTPEQLESIGELEDETLMTWTGGLQFEDLISEGTRQPAHVYCHKCKTVSSPPISIGPLIECPGYIWDEEGNETHPFGKFLSPSDVEEKKEDD